MPEVPLPESIRDRPETQMLWDDGMQAIDKLFQALEGTNPCSLRLSAGELESRRELQLKIVQLKKEATKGLDRVDDLRRKMFDTLRLHAAEIDASMESATNNDMSEKMTGSSDKTPRPNDLTCGGDDDDDKTPCPEKCEESVDVPAVKSRRTAKVSATLDQLRKKCDMATSEESLREHIVATIREEISMELDHVESTIADLHVALLDLEKSQSRSLGAMTIKECYDKLILAQEADRKEGWNTRVVTLKQLRVSAVSLAVPMEPVPVCLHSNGTYMRPAPSWICCIFTVLCIHKCCFWLPWALPYCYSFWLPWALPCCYRKHVHCKKCRQLLYTKTAFEFDYETSE